MYPDHNKQPCAGWNPDMSDDSSPAAATVMKLEAYRNKFTTAYYACSVGLPLRHVADVVDLLSASWYPGTIV